MLSSTPGKIHGVQAIYSLRNATLCVRRLNKGCWTPCLTTIRGAYLKLVDLADLAFAVSETSTRHSPPNFRQRVHERRSGAHVALFEPGMKPGADHGCTGSSGSSWLGWEDEEAPPRAP